MPKLAAARFRKEIQEFKQECLKYQGNYKLVSPKYHPLKVAPLWLDGTCEKQTRPPSKAPGNRRGDGIGLDKWHKQTKPLASRGALDAMLHSHGVMGLTFGMTAKTQFQVGRLFGAQNRCCAAKNAFRPSCDPPLQRRIRSVSAALSCHKLADHPVAMQLTAAPSF